MWETEAREVHSTGTSMMCGLWSWQTGADDKAASIPENHLCGSAFLFLGRWASVGHLVTVHRTSRSLLPLALHGIFCVTSSRQDIEIQMNGRGLNLVMTRNSTILGFR